MLFADKRALETNLKVELLTIRSLLAITHVLAGRRRSVMSVKSIELKQRENGHIDEIEKWTKKSGRVKKNGL